MEDSCFWWIFTLFLCGGWFEFTYNVGEFAWSNGRSSSASDPICCSDEPFCVAIAGAMDGSNAEVNRCFTIDPPWHQLFLLWQLILEDSSKVCRSSLYRLSDEQIIPVLFAHGFVWVHFWGHYTTVYWEQMQESLSWFQVVMLTIRENI